MDIYNQGTWNENKNKEKYVCVRCSMERTTAYVYKLSDKLCTECCKKVQAYCRGSDGDLEM